MTSTGMTRPARGGVLHREIRGEDEAETILRALAGTWQTVREHIVDVAGAARWLQARGWTSDEITAALTALSTLALLAVRGDGWHLLASLFGDGDGRFFILETLEAQPGVQLELG